MGYNYHLCFTITVTHWCVPQEDRLTKFKRKHSDLEEAKGDICEESSKLLHSPPRLGSPAHVRSSHVSNSCVVL